MTTLSFMALKRMDHVGVLVDNLETATAKSQSAGYVRPPALGNNGSLIVEVLREHPVPTRPSDMIPSRERIGDVAGCELGNSATTIYRPGRSRGPHG